MVVTSGLDHLGSCAVADERLRGWLGEAGYDTGAAADGPGRVRLAPGAWLDADAEADRTGAYTRWRLRESGPEGLRQTTLLVRARPGAATPRVCLTAEQLPAAPGARPGWSEAPTLVGPLLAGLAARDGRVAVTAGPRPLGPADLDRLLAELRDPERRLPIVLLATAPPAAEALTRHLPGLAVCYLLTPEARAAVNQALAHHQVPSGGARSYLPGVEPDQAADGFRHPAMPRPGLGEDLERVGRLLARLPRRLAARAPLPAELATVPALHGRPQPPAVASRAELERLREENALLNGLLEEAGHEESARRGEIGELRQELRAQEEHAFELSVELAEQAEELRRTSAQLRDLRRGPADPHQADPHQARPAPCAHPAPYADPAPHPAHGNPGGFAALLERIAELSELRFTGSRRITVELDAQVLGPHWAATAWDALLALQDYARARREGAPVRDFLHWCRETPAGGHRFPPGKVVRDESPQTAGRRSWRRQRTFPVPVAVDPSGAAFMGAHLRIGAGNSKAPRLHFLDDSPHGGRIYLGYLGPHLANTLSAGI